MAQQSKTWYYHFFTKLIRLFVTYYASKKHLKKEVHHLLSIVYNVDESIEVFMKRFYEEKMEIFDCPDSIRIQEFRRGVLWSLKLFVKLTKMVRQTMREAYKEVQKFVNPERELKLVKKKDLNHIYHPKRKGKKIVEFERA